MLKGFGGEGVRRLGIIDTGGGSWRSIKSDEVIGMSVRVLGMQGCSCKGGDRT